MISISVKGIEDGNYDINTTFDTAEVENLAEEFFGEILVKGKLVKLKEHYNFQGTAECKAKFLCDRSLNEYEDNIVTELKWSCVRNTDLFNELKQGEPDPGRLAIHNDAQEIDITEEVVEQLFVAIPMKRISPEYRSKDLKDIYPEHAADDDDKNDPRWSKLKDLKLN